LDQLILFFLSDLLDQLILFFLSVLYNQLNPLLQLNQ
jgi:hypothetical protein